MHPFVSNSQLLVHVYATFSTPPPPLCILHKECFFTVFEDEVHQTIEAHNLFKKGQRIAIAAVCSIHKTALSILRTHICCTIVHSFSLDCRIMHHGLDFFYGDDDTVLCIDCDEIDSRRASI